MKAMVLKGPNLPFQLEQRPDPSAGPGEAVARVITCGAGRSRGGANRDHSLRRPAGMQRDVRRLDQPRLLRRPVAADRVRHHPARRREAERAGHRSPVPGTAHGADPDGRGRIDQSDAASRCSPDPGRLAEGQSAEDDELIHSPHNLQTSPRTATSPRSSLPGLTRQSMMSARDCSL